MRFSIHVLAGLFIMLFACRSEDKVSPGTESESGSESTASQIQDTGSGSETGSETHGTSETLSGSESETTDETQTASATETATQTETDTSSETVSESVDTVEEPFCGDDSVNGTELCERGDTASCEEVDTGFRSGRAECDAECGAWNVAACTYGVCANGEIETDEACDGDTLDCAVLDAELYSGGTASCNAFCTAYDASTCELTGPLTFEIGFGGEDGDNGWDAVQTYDGGYLVAGYTFSFVDGGLTPDDPEFLTSNYDAFVVRLDPQGEVLWHKSYGGVYPEATRAIIRAHDGGYILAGDATVVVGSVIIDFGEEEIEFDKIREQATLTKIDENGEVIWTRDYGETELTEYFGSVMATSDGNYVAVGEKVLFKGDNQDAPMVPFPSLGNAQKYNYAVKVDPFGSVLWEKAFFGPGSRWGNLASVVEVDDGYVACGGMVLAGQDGRDTFAVELAANSGDVVWQQRYPGAVRVRGDDYAAAVAVLRDALGDVTGFALVGVEDNNYDYQDLTLSGDIRVVFTDESGNLVASKVYDISGESIPGTGYVKHGIDFGVDVVSTAEGDIVVLATVLYDIFFQPYEESDTYLMRLGQDGVVQWSQRYGTLQTYDTPSSLIPTSDGGYLVTGSTQSFLPEEARLRDDFYMIKTDASGSL